MTVVVILYYEIYISDQIKAYPWKNVIYVCIWDILFRFFSLRFIGRNRIVSISRFVLLIFGIIEGIYFFTVRIQTITKSRIIVGPYSQN